VARNALGPVATGLYVGCLPGAPGTYGTLWGVGRGATMVPLERCLVSYAGLRGDACGSRPETLDPGERHALFNAVPPDTGAMRKVT